MPRVAIIDHGLGNLQAVEKALTRAGGGANVFRSFDPDAVRRADRVVLSGTGGLQQCVDELRRLGMDEVLAELLENRPLLAIDVGLHALGRQGLGLLPFDVRPLSGNGVRLPHMGWNRVRREHGDALWDGIPQDGFFYFTHRECIANAGPLVAGESEHGERFASVLARGCFVGVQFHPEISHVQGLHFLANFVNRDEPGETDRD